MLECVHGHGRATFDMESKNLLKGGKYVMYNYATMYVRGIYIYIYIYIHKNLLSQSEQ